MHKSGRALLRVMTVRSGVKHVWVRLCAVWPAKSLYLLDFLMTNYHRFKVKNVVVLDFDKGQVFANNIKDRDVKHDLYLVSTL